MSLRVSVRVVRAFASGRGHRPCVRAACVRRACVRACVSAQASAHAGARAGARADARGAVGRGVGVGVGVGVGGGGRTHGSPFALLEHLNVEQWVVSSPTCGCKGG